MATKQDIQTRGFNAYGTDETNPYKAGSWQHTAWNDGHEAADDQSHAAPPVYAGNNLPRDTVGGISIPFPARMPQATRQHILCLETAQSKRQNDGSFLVRTSNKINKLYAKWA